MYSISDQHDSTYLRQPPPRPLSPMVVLNLISDHLLARPQRAFLDPLLILGIVGLVGLLIVRTNAPLWLLPLLAILARLTARTWRVVRRILDDLALLREGLIIRAHILRLRPYRSTTGQINGALLDCAIPIAPRRTAIGSIWLADGGEAIRLVHQGRIDVICLPRAPGTWRVIEKIASEIRYEHLGTQQQIPLDT